MNNNLNYEIKKRLNSKTWSKNISKAVIDKYSNERFSKLQFLWTVAAIIILIFSFLIKHYTNEISNKNTVDVYSIAMQNNYNLNSLSDIFSDFIE